jgi:hypothetical protein
VNAWETLMVLAGGLFAGGSATFAWSRVPIWRRMAVHQFVVDFGQTLAWTDKVQPGLLVAAIVSSVAFVLTTTETPRVVALAGTVGFVATLLASLAVLVPLQRAILATPLDESDAIEGMRLRWFRGNLGRSVLATLAFAAIAAAAAM